MADSLSDKLRALIRTHGPALIRDVRRCGGMVRDACEGKTREINLLLGALDEDVPGKLVEQANGTLDVALRNRLSQLLQENRGLNESAANWAVETWAYALGLTDNTAGNPTSNPAPVATPAAAPAPATMAAPAPVPTTMAAPAAFDIDPPACFYLGREYDLDNKAVLPDKYVMYDAKDLTTHGVIVGMTGSGKTGLAINLLEEAAIDGYPCIMVDPKGDLTNLLLQFPNLSPAEFEKWVNPEDAQQKGISVRQYAEEVAARWRKGLAETNQTPERIGRLRASADWRIYTPGSETGLLLSILHTFAAPKGNPPREALTSKIDTTVTALLGLTGIEADPIQSREHILLAQLLLNAWEASRDLDLPQMILQIRNPPIQTVGAYNLETFFPAKERIKFASTLNNVLAAPSFSTWTTGEPLDLASMLYRAGKPQQLLFYTAHLDDRQRMFFTTLLLGEVLSWMRAQRGSTTLRALFYMDEVFGYLPPAPAAPPSKGPLLTLLKQARAFGVGILLATQNPIDLDYKALSNAGTWFVGKLQTVYDKMRLLDGLESVAAEQGTLTDRAYLETVISSLGNRIFLMHDVHRPKPVLFQSRWALSYLRGPLTRDEVSRLMKPVKEQAATGGAMAIPLCTHCHAELGPEVGDTCPSCGKHPWANAQFRRQEKAFREGLMGAAAPASTPSSVNHLPPVLPADVTQFYLSAQGPARGPLEYQPRVLGAAEVAFVVDKRKGVEHTQTFRLLAQPAAAGHPTDWDSAEPAPAELALGPMPGARWAGVPDTLDTARKLKAMEKAFTDWLYSTQKLALFENRTLGLVSAAGEGRSAFQGRCRLAAVEQAEKALAMEKVKFTPKFEALGMRLPEEPVKKSVGFWSWLTASVTPVAAKKPSGPASSRQEEKQRKLTADYQSKKNEICEKWKNVGEEATPVEVKPRKIDVHVTHFGLAWTPCWTTAGKTVPAYRA
jgi:hypothetical protein